MPFPAYSQLDAMDCGPTCIKIIGKYYGKRFSLQMLREKSQISRDGVSLMGISEAASQLGFRTVSIKTDLDTLAREKALPCVAHWKQNHFIVIYKINARFVWVSDPAKGLIKYTKSDFHAGWGIEKKEDLISGIVMLAEPTARFYSDQDEEESGKLSLQYISAYFTRYRKLFLQLLLGLLVGNLLQLFFPFFTQAIVDVGIATKDIQLVYLLLIGQLLMFAGSTMVDFMRGWIMLHITTRINLSLLSDFLSKLMRLPVSFFDVKLMGDIMQRMSDHSRVQSFLTGNAVSTLFSVFNFVVFSCIIIAYDAKLFLIFITGSIIYFLWVFAFQRVRRRLDFKMFDISAINQSSLIQLISGMQEIKMNTCEQQKRWHWERIQAKLFKLNTRVLSINQIQEGGAFFITQTKNILITFLSAQAVISGKLTLGEMMAVQYILGQLNGPIQQFISLMQGYQSARISLERINEIHQIADEEPVNKSFMNQLPPNKSIHIRDLHYKYPGADNNWALKNINLTIPAGKTTAIVGVSGSGKTTLLKLLLKFYAPTSGEIKVSDVPFNLLGYRYWRSRCGTVLQDGFIFSDTILNNIAVKDEQADMEKLKQAMEISNIHDFITTLPLGFNTKIGAEGNGISQGQKQRILIARAVYKDPEYIFFDEATNSLDAINERTILNNMEEFLAGRTVVVVAHRLSTVKNAHQIAVMHEGEIAELGTHEELIARKGHYYKLIENQLEVDN